MMAEVVAKITLKVIGFRHCVKGFAYIIVFNK